jgi:UDP-N-acetylglucosamine 1-carboxyvinyltransferase
MSTHPTTPPQPGPKDPTDLFVVRGAGPLSGEVRVHGAKNSALKLMAAALLAEGTTVLDNVPLINDVPVMGEILTGVGAEVEVDGETCVIAVEGEPDHHAPADAVSRIRASISTLGPLLARTGRARLALPGGDRIGARGIDLHLRGLAAMGAVVDQDADEVEVRAEKLRGARITLDFPSVGATENLVMAATRADGVTVLDNAAREPEIQDLCRMLVAMGARIDGVGSATLTVEGVDRMYPVRWSVCPDRVEAGTFLVAGALTGGEVTVTAVRPGDLHLPLLKLEAMGVEVDDGVDTITVRAGALQATNVVTLPYPGFPTDLQPQLMVLMTQAMGTSRCTENVFESRFSFVEELERMGADIVVDGHHAMIRGAVRLRGAHLAGLDVRAGAAGVLAGLVAEGGTVVHDVHHVDRGYTDLVGALTSLGADIERVPAGSRPEPTS